MLPPKPSMSEQSGVSRAGPLELHSFATRIWCGIHDLCPYIRSRAYLVAAVNAGRNVSERGTGCALFVIGELRAGVHSPGSPDASDCGFRGKCALGYDVIKECM